VTEDDIPVSRPSKKDSENLHRVIYSPTQLGPEVTATQIWQWIGTAFVYAERLIKNQADFDHDAGGLFWIRLYGILVDLRAKFKSWKEVNEALVYSPHPEVKEFQKRYFPSALEWCTRAVELINGLYISFSEEELIYIQYRRHVEAHPFQKSYEVQMGKNNKVIDKLPHAILDNKVINREQVHEILGRVLKQYKSERIIAVEFAKRSFPYLLQLHTLTTFLKR